MASLICTLLQLYIFVLLVRVVLSWFPISPHGAMATVAGLPLHGHRSDLIPRAEVPTPVRMGLRLALDLSPAGGVFAHSF
jgi:hypothetical protein